MTGWVLAMMLLVGPGSGFTATVAAQAGTTAVVVGGLQAPRGLAFGPNGDLYVAEAGTGGDEQIEWGPPFRSARLGASGRILRVDGGRSIAVVSGLQSLALGPGREVVGVQDLAFVGPMLYAVVGQMNPLPSGRETRSLLVRLGPDGSVETVADLGRFERESDPDGARPDSNPFDLVAGPDGSLYVAEAGANAVLRVAPDGQVSPVAVWRDNPVPTGIAFDRSGRAHVSFLSEAPFAVGSARIERLAADGTEVVVPNLTMAVDLTFGPDGALYVLEMAAAFDASQPPPRYREQSGRVLRVTTTGTEVVAGRLNFPSKLAFGPDGALYVTNNASFVTPGRGEVLKITLPRLVAPPPAPAPAQIPRSG